MSPDESSYCCVPVEQAALLVDGACYFQAFHSAAQQARRSILVAGWQFDPQVLLVRGESDAAPAYPFVLWELLNALCIERPELEVYVLAWDYSLVYAFEREWLPMAQARLSAHRRIHFRWRSHADPRGSHHQKFVVIDDTLAFAGGLDLCKGRWDTRSHAPHHPERAEGTGTPWRKPFHDVQAALCGPAAERLAGIFWEAWQQCGSSDTRPEASPPAARRSCDLASVCGSEALMLGAGRVHISRTAPPAESENGVCEVLRMYQRLFASARRLIYIETQYFTSSAISRALLKRMSDTSLPSLTLILVMPEGADSFKEQLVLGKRQEQVLSAICSGAQRFGHQVRLLYSIAGDYHGRCVTTYIHSKLTIVDDQAITIGSANLTNRSMGLDTELNLTWNPERCEDMGDVLARARASLLAEHAGVSDLEQFLDVERLLAVLDEHCERPDSRLRKRSLEPADASDPLIMAIFDPATVLEHQDWDRIWEEVLGLNDEGVLKRSWQSLKRLLLASDGEAD